MDRHKILIIGNKKIENAMLINILDKYEVKYIINSGNVVAIANSFKPSLIIFDLDNVREEDYLQCINLKTNCYTKNIPIIFMSDSDIVDPSKIIEAGAIDYIEKPFNAKILICKVNNYIKLYSSIIELEESAINAKELNPNTSLPGNTSIKNNISNALHSHDNLVVVYADLDNFKAYNDKYGFSKGDEVIKLTGNIINDELSNIDGFTFLGHIGGDDFIFIAPKAHIKEISYNILNNFDNNISKHYDEQDINAGYVVAKSRKGRKQKYPLMTISLGGVDLSNYPSSTAYNEIVDLCTETKKLAKTYSQSCFIMDERNNNTVEDYIAALSPAI